MVPVDIAEVACNRREALRKVSLTGGLPYSKYVPRPIL